MGWIANKLSKYVDPQPKAPDWANHPHIQFLKHGPQADTFTVVIAGNKIDSLRIPMDMKFWQYDLANSPLSFLLNSKFQAKHVWIVPERHRSENYKIKNFNGDWEMGNLVCEQFFGSITGGTLNGVYRRKFDNKMTIVHPGVNITGDYNHNSTTSSNIDDKDAVYGFGPYNPSTFSVNTPEKKISILGLNTGQVVSITTDKNDTFSFLVQKSYKETGQTIAVKELSHNYNVVELCWTDFRGINTQYSKIDFDVRTQIAIGETFGLPKLFEGYLKGKVISFNVSNGVNQLQQNPAHPQRIVNSNFKPTLLKF
jgi:hypothetical protein